MTPIRPDRPERPCGGASSACFRGCYNLLVLLPPSNEIFVPASEPRILIYGGRNVVLAPITGAGGEIS
jgi:hypothetical protein